MAQTIIQSFRCIRMNWSAVLVCSNSLEGFSRHPIKVSRGDKKSRIFQPTAYFLTIHIGAQLDIFNYFREISLNLAKMVKVIVGMMG